MRAAAGGMGGVSATAAAAMPAALGRQGEPEEQQRGESRAGGPTREPAVGVHLGDHGSSPFPAPRRILTRRGEDLECSDTEAHPPTPWVFREANSAKRGPAVPCRIGLSEYPGCGRMCFGITTFKV